MTGQKVTENGNEPAVSEGVWTMTDTELNEELRRAKEQAWDAGWNAGMRFESPKNPYRSEQ